MIYIVLTFNPERELESCKAFKSILESEIYLKEWAEENGITLDPDETEAEIYLEECDECENGEYISFISDENIGTCQILPTEIE